MSVDYSIIQRLQAARDENSRLRTTIEQTPHPLEPGGGGGDSGGMDGLSERVTRVEVRLDGIEHQLGAVEARMNRLEGRMDRLETRMDGIDTRLRGVELSLAGIAAKLDVLTTQVVGKLPSWWQMPAVIGSTVALLAALWAAGRYLASRGLL